jgi:phosphoribosylanthranilate isomerase
MTVKVKICGITNVEDALVAAEAGAEALGFVFYEASPRSVSLKTASSIVRQLPPFLIKVGVFVDAPPEVVTRAVRECRLSLLQFHGSETPEYCLQFGVMTMKAFQVKDAASLLKISNYKTDAWLLDAYSAEAKGGTGETFNWDHAIEAKRWGRPIFLAGGLTPANVVQAVRCVQPYGVDVSSGVESAPGKKDPDKVRAFVQAAHGVSGWLPPRPEAD